MFVDRFQEEAEKRREERRKAKLQQLWTANNYRSCRVSVSDDEDESSDQVETVDDEGDLDRVIESLFF